MSVLTRRRYGAGFAYYEDGIKVTDRQIIDRCNSLAVPPAWRQVEIATSPRAKVQACGIDGAGRTQIIYNRAFRARQERLKFDRVLRFADRLPALRRQVEADLAKKRLSRDKVLATIVRLIDTTYIRVGSEQSARQYQHYGATTLRRKHLRTVGDTVVFDFVGKSGQSQHQEVTDQQIARVIRQLDELPGHEIFRYEDADGVLHDLRASDVNQYIKRIVGDDFSAKDFRTWGGTLLAVTELAGMEFCEKESERKKRLSHIVRCVAEQLGNTPAVTRSSYIDPRALAVFDDEKSFNKLHRTLQATRHRKYMNRTEVCTRTLLDTMPYRK